MLKQLEDANGKPLFDSNGKPLMYESTAEEPAPGKKTRARSAAAPSEPADEPTPTE